MFIIKIENNKPVGNPLIESNFRQQFGNVSFPLPITPGDVSPFGYGLYELTEKPTPGKHQKVVEGDPVQNNNSVWIQTWNLVEKNAEEKAEEDEEQAKFVRGDRTTRLAFSDWTQLPDSTVDKAAWATYRQQLRDVTLQPGFPWSITWPTPPNS